MPGIVQDTNNDSNTNTNSTSSCHEEEMPVMAGMLLEQLQPAASIKLMLPQQDDNNNWHN